MLPICLLSIFVFFLGNDVVSSLCVPVIRQNCSQLITCECFSPYTVIPPVLPPAKYCMEFTMPLCPKHVITFKGSVCSGGAECIDITFYDGENNANPEFGACLDGMPNPRYLANDNIGGWNNEVEQVFSYPMRLQPDQKIEVAFVMDGDTKIEERVNNDHVGVYVLRQGANIRDLKKVCFAGCATFTQIDFGGV